jgi:hypothetical protein
MKERGIITALTVLIVFMLSVPAAVVVKYCKPPVAFTWADGCVPIQPLPQQGDTKESP